MKGDGAGGCGDSRGRSPVRSQAHSPTTETAAVP